MVANRVPNAFWTAVISTVLCVASFAPQVMAADAISVNVTGDQNGNNASTAITNADGNVGAAPRQNWNNTTGANGTLAAGTVLDNTGAVVTNATVQWACGNTWSNGNNAAGNNKLFNGYLDDGYGNPNNPKIIVTNIPFAVYDVYVYGHSDSGNGQQLGVYYCDDGAAGSHNTFTDSGAKSMQQSDNGGFGGTFTESKGNGEPGNYIRFRNRTASSVTVSSFEMRGTVIRSGLAGIQIVAVTPAITSVTQNTGTTAGGDYVTVSGAGFVSGSSVTFGGNAGTVIYIDGGTLLVKTPAGAAGAVNVVYTGTNGTNTLTNGFTYGGAAPTLGDAISFRFGGNGQNGGRQVMGAAEVAGKIPRANWNNGPQDTNTGTLTGLLDNAGTNQGVSVSWNCNESWTNGDFADAAGNARMMRGYINQTNDSPMSVTFNNLPANWQAFDMYVYASGIGQRSSGVYQTVIRTADGCGGG